MKCVKCGKIAVAEHFCKDCFLDSYNNTKGFKEFVLQYCTSCNRYSYTKRWEARLPLEGAIIKAVKSNIKTQHKPLMIKVTPLLSQYTTEPGVKLKINIDVDVSTFIHGLTKDESFNIPLKITFMLCPRCQRMMGQYFEGVIQLRNKKSHAFEKAVQFIYNEISKHQHKGVSITKEEPVSDGVDLYCSSQRFLPILVKKVYAKFGGECNLTSRNFTLDKLTSKQVYRVNALLRLPMFDAGDVIKVEHRIIKIESTFGNKISGIDLKYHKKILLPYAEYEILANKNETIDVIITKHKPRLEVLDPISYQSVAVENQKETHGDSVKCIRVYNKLWIIE